MIKKYPSTFKKDRKKIFKLFQEVVDGKIIASTSSDDMIKVKSKAGIKHEFIEYIISDFSTDDDVNIYYGESKKGVPHGKGIPFQENSDMPVFAGNFKNGKVKGYGIIFKFGQIMIESEKCSYRGDEEFLAGGKTIRYATTIDSELLRNIYYEAYNAAGYSNKDMFDMMSIAPEVIYEGNMERSKRSRKGSSYFELYSTVSSSSEAAGKLYGQLRYEGDWKYNEFQGKGKLYTADGGLKYSGKFSGGKIKN